MRNDLKAPLPLSTGQVSIHDLTRAWTEHTLAELDQITETATRARKISGLPLAKQLEYDTILGQAMEARRLIALAFTKATEIDTERAARSLAATVCTVCNSLHAGTRCSTR